MKLVVGVMLVLIGVPIFVILARTLSAAIFRSYFEAKAYYEGSRRKREEERKEYVQ